MKTAVEWFSKEIKLLLLEKDTGLDIMSFMKKYNERFKQAKAMEKEQHDKTAEEWWKEGAHYMESGGRAKWESFEQYYNETFKSE